MKLFSVNTIPAPIERYSQQLEDLRWKFKSENIRKRDGHSCRMCGIKNTQLDVHHIRYIKNKSAWDYDDGDLITLCHRCHEEVHKRQLFIDSLHGGSFFYHVGLVGVGIIKDINDNGIWFKICWTEKESFEGEDHGRLYCESEAAWDDIRRATDKEIIEFWNKIDKYCSDCELLFYVNCYKELIPDTHHLCRRLEQIIETGQYYNDGSQIHIDLARHNFENYVKERQLIGRDFKLQYDYSKFNPFNQHYEITQVYFWQNKEKEISGTLEFNPKNDGSFRVDIWV